MNLCRLIKRSISLMILIATTSCTTTMTPSSTSTREISEIEVPPVESHWDEVQNLAREWDTDAFVSEIVVYLPSATDQDETAFFHFYVQSSKRQFTYLKIYCTKYLCTFDEVEVANGVSLCKPILRDDFKMDSDQVFRMVLGSEKRDLLNEELVSTDFKMTRQYEGTCQGEQVVWIVDHTDVEKMRSYIMVIDASTGKIIKHYNE